MVAAQNTYAPAIRFDADDRNEQAIIDARNIAVTFKVEHGTVEAVKDISFQLYRGDDRHCWRIRFGKIGDRPHHHGAFDEAGLGFENRDRALQR